MLSERTRNRILALTSVTHQRRLPIYLPMNYGYTTLDSLPGFAGPGWDGMVGRRGLARHPVRDGRCGRILAHVGGLPASAPGTAESIAGPFYPPSVLPVRLRRRRWLAVPRGSADGKKTPARGRGPEPQSSGRGVVTSAHRKTGFANRGVHVWTTDKSPHPRPWAGGTAGFPKGVVPKMPGALNRILEGLIPGIPAAWVQSSVGSGMRMTWTSRWLMPGSSWAPMAKGVTVWPVALASSAARWAARSTSCC